VGKDDGFRTTSFSTLKKNSEKLESLRASKVDFAGISTSTCLQEEREDSSDTRSDPDYKADAAVSEQHVHPTPQIHTIFYT